MSVASGIPDFRSANGLYQTLDATKLTATPEQIEQIEIDPSYCLDHHLFMVRKSYVNNLPFHVINSIDDGSTI